MMTKQQDQPQQWTDEDVAAASPDEVRQAMKAGLLKEHLGVGDGRDRRAYLPEDYGRGLPPQMLDQMTTAHRREQRRWVSAASHRVAGRRQPGNVQVRSRISIRFRSHGVSLRKRARKANR